jgi:hypothetical protein
LSVTATGGTPSLSYQWQSSTDNVTFNNITGATSSSYTSSALATTAYYRVVVSATGNGCGSVTSSSATVTVVADPAITAQPMGSTICSGGMASLSVTATGGTPSLGYQWQSSTDNVTFNNITGATSSSYATPSLAATTYYRAIVSATGSGCGSVTSSSATVTVNPGLGITAQPTSSTICNGGTATMSITATGNPSYQWQSSADNVTFVNIAGATGSSYTTPALATTTYYQVVLTSNNCGSFNSITATVTVVADPAITAQPSGSTICAGGTATLSVTATGGTPSLSYQWQSSTDNVTFNNITGATSSSYTSPALATTAYYRVAVSATGNGCGSVTSSSATVTVVADPAITAQPMGSTICSGGMASLSVTATGGTPSLGYQWQSSTDNVTFANIAGATSSSYTSPALATTAYYRVVVSATGNGCGSVTSSSATVTIGGCGEVCDNGIDDDGDGLVDCADSDCQIIQVFAGNDINTCIGANIPLTATVTQQELLTNQGFESGLAAPWTLGTGASVVNNNARNGSYALTVAGDNTGFYRTLTGLKPNTTYTFSAFAKHEFAFEPGGTGGYIFARNYGGPEVNTAGTSTSSLSIFYESRTVTFTTGATNTSVEIGGWRSGTGVNDIYFDDLTLTNAYSSEWSNGLGSGDTHTVSPSGTTTYTVTVTSSAGCTATDQVTIHIHNCVYEDCDNGTDDDGDGTADCDDSDCNIPATACDNNLVTNLHTKVTAYVPANVGTAAGYQTISHADIIPGNDYCISFDLAQAHVFEPASYNQNTVPSEIVITINDVPRDTFLLDDSDLNLYTFVFSLMTAPGENYVNIGLESHMISPGTFGFTSTNICVTQGTCIAVESTSCNCGNGIDDDGDGLVDCADPDCASSFTFPVSTNATADTICRGENTTISASASGGTGPYTYNWSNGLGAGVSHNITPLTTTTYTVTVTSAPGCTSTEQVTITVNLCAEDCTDGIDNDGDGLVDCDDPDCGLSLTAAPTDASCGINDGQVTISASGGSGSYEYSYDNMVWLSPNTFTGLAPGTHTFFARNDDGTCPASVDATVGEACEDCTDGIDNDGDGLVDCADPDCRPTASAGSNVSICVGASTTLTASAIGGTTPYTFAWSNGLGAGATKTVSPAATTTYTVTVTGASGCTSTAQLTVTVTTCAENCTDGIDNDGDGLTDCADPDCAATAAPQLNDDVFTTCPGAGPYGNLVSINDGNLVNPTFTIVAPPAKGSVVINNFGAFNYIPADSQCGSVSFTYRTCNASGCCATATATINIGDNLPPTLLNVPADIDISCDDEIPQPPVVVATDLCPYISISVSDTDDQGSLGACGTYTITRTWTATDLCGNSALDSQLITVSDQTRPELFRVYTLPNGKKMVAGRAERTSGIWKYVKFPLHFDAPPLVFAQVASNNDAAAVTVQTRYISTTGFEIRLREEEAADQLHGGEVVNWMAVEPGNVDGAYKMAAQLMNNVNHNDQSLTYPLAFSSRPVFIASVNGMVQADPVSVRTKTETANGLTVSLQEEQSADSETAHANEKLAWLALSAGSNVYDKDGGFVAEGGTVSANHNWATVNLAHRFTKPIVLFGGIPSTDGQAATVRVRNVTPTSFQVRVQEWAYLDGSHANEGIGYLVVEGSIPTDDGFYCFNDDPLQPGIDIIAIDNCDGQVAFGYDEMENMLHQGLETIRTWTAIDDCGNVNLLTRWDTCRVAAVRLRTLLNGALVSAGTSGLMRDDLRAQQHIPAKEPYSALSGFQHRGSGGKEEISSQLLYEAGSKAVTDWLFVECRDPLDPQEVLATCAVVVRRDGSVVTSTGDSVLYFWDLPQDDYYVSVRHRNHLGMATANTVHLCSENPPMVDFTSTGEATWGGTNSGKLQNGRRTMWSGDFNGDGKAIYQGPYNDVFFLFSKVLSDPDNTELLANFIVKGYNRADFNLDGQSIYQGPNNDRSMLLLNTILAHSTNQTLLANFIALQWLP